jgi:hypothetical protein
MMRLMLAFALAASLASGPAGCGVSHDPEKTVTVEIIGIRSDAERKQVRETLEKMTESSWHYITSTASGNSMTIQVSPVSDVEKFSKRITFGKVTEVRGRTVKVDFLQAPDRKDIRA